MYIISMVHRDDSWEFWDLQQQMDPAMEPMDLG
jgi:hypothetical protein